MNKKLLLATMSLAVLAACTNDDDFGSKNIAENASPVQFEVLNNNQALTRATMDGNTIQWSAEDGDLFTLYHGCNAENEFTTGYQNATYKASSEEGAAILSTPSMILPGKAIMVWPVDTTFRIASNGKLSITIPAVQKNIENNIPYVSDLIEIEEYDGHIENPNTAGYNRVYPIYMRPMASQLIVKADYAGTDETIAALYEGGSACPADGGIEPISLTSVELITAEEGGTKFTTQIPVKFSDPEDIDVDWDDAVENNAWTHVTDFDLESEDIDSEAKLTAKDDCIDGTDGCKFLILPQAGIENGVADAAVVVNTLYGKVVISAAEDAGSQYTQDELADAWYRYLSNAANKEEYETAAAAGSNGKSKTTTTVANGLMQTINGFSEYVATKGIVKNEPIGAAATRYVKVLLNYLDMSDLHVKNDKHLRDVAVVWKYLYPETNQPIEVILDGDDDGEFAISQNTIKYINTLKDEDGNQLFKVKPCVEEGEECETIVITGGGDIQDIDFIVANGEEEPVQAAVALNEGETWKWNGTNTAVNATLAQKIVKIGAGVSEIINRGTLVNAATATLANYGYGEDALIQTNVPLVNEGTWNITAGTLNVQFSVTNLGTVNIAKGAQYRQDGQGHIFTNEAKTLPQRFLAANKTEEIGVVNNKGVFATVNDATINNYGLIEHADKDAMTMITTNQTEGANFATLFSNEEEGINKMGRINLPYGNKDENNISISAQLNQGFVSITVDGEVTDGVLNTAVVGPRVNYVIVKSGVSTISALPNTISYVEINEPGTMIDWTIAEAGYEGLIVLSDVNITLDTKVAAKATYLGADMYVSGVFNKAAAVTINKGTAANPDNVEYQATAWSMYYGNTTDNVATKYITFGTTPAAEQEP